MDPINDMFNQIRNAQAVFSSRIIIPWSNLKYKICKILEKEGFVEKAEKKRRQLKKIIEINLKYVSEKESVKIPKISSLKRISKPGQRIYSPFKKIKKATGHSGIVIISTSKGLMTGKEARRKKLGGEIICEIW